MCRRGADEEGFIQVLMTRRDLLRCHNEPFADPFFCGPEGLSERFRVHGKKVTADGFDGCTYESRVALIERENVAEEVRMLPAFRTVLNLLN